ncbi:STARD3 N-terminal-like protein isoform 1-T2 [Syngnathus typhle]
MDSRCSSSTDSRVTGGYGARSSTSLQAHMDSYKEEKTNCISDVRRTFCLFVTFDLLFVTLLWIIELNVNGGLPEQLNREVVHYDYHASFFDIFVRKHDYLGCTFWVDLLKNASSTLSPRLPAWAPPPQLLAVFRFAVLILAYAVCRLSHWWAVAITTAVSCAFLIGKVIFSKLLSQGAFGYLLPIISFVLAWIETWLLDFKVLPQEADDQNRYRCPPDATAAERAPLFAPGPMSDGQFYSPPDSVADTDEDLEDKR